MMTKSEKTLRLNSYLSKAGIAARRKCDRIIKEGYVRVNGGIIREPGHKVEPGIDKVYYRSSPVYIRKDFRYVLLNKPRGVICTASDEKKRKTVMELIDIERRLFPVGRLDLNTTGLLLLTDDGDLSYRLTHPKFKIEKTYHAELHKPVNDAALKRLENGVLIGKKEFVKAECRSINYRKTKVAISIHEGKKHIVKRMMEVLGYKVTALERVKFAGLTVKKIPKGGWRYLSKNEVEKIYKITGLDIHK
ncbi:MAG: rRNA pseudouridine synthase [bacterium]|nr:rRNA pseudouridine synthase [bacterium]